MQNIELSEKMYIMLKFFLDQSTEIDPNSVTLKIPEQVDWQQIPINHIDSFCDYIRAYPYDKTCPLKYRYQLAMSYIFKTSGGNCEGFKQVIKLGRGSLGRILVSLNHADIHTSYGRKDVLEIPGTTPTLYMQTGECKDSCIEMIKRMGRRRKLTSELYDLVASYYIP